MTAQEKDRIECAIQYIKTSADVDPWAVEISVEAMQKQIPKKPIKSFNPHDNDSYRLDCPTCERIVGYGNNRVGTMKKFTMSPDRCSFCGQAIDWEDGE